MNVARLRRWDVTAIEIALDLEIPPLSESTRLGFSGPAEPRICLVAAFALTPQLRRIVTAVDRALPPRLPPTLHVAPPKARAPANSSPGSVSIRPMVSLIRIQSKLIRAIEPGLARVDAREADANDAIAQYVCDFIPSNALPALEPSPAVATFAPIDLAVCGLTIYRLEPNGRPQSILGHWTYAPRARASIPLRSGP